MAKIMYRKWKQFKANRRFIYYSQLFYYQIHEVNFLTPRSFPMIESCDSILIQFFSQIFPIKTAPNCRSESQVVGYLITLTVSKLITVGHLNTPSSAYCDIWQHSEIFIYCYVFYYKGCSKRQKWGTRWYIIGTALCSGNKSFNYWLWATDLHLHSFLLPHRLCGAQYSSL